jgi:hypothetical protein
MVIKQSFEQVFDSKIENYNAPKRVEMNGITIYFKPSDQQHSVPWHEWEQVLEDLIPKFEVAGWLEEFTNINIKDGLVRGDGVGMYSPDCHSIDLENKVDGIWYSSRVLSDSPKHVLVHEMIHHAHLTLIGFDDRDTDFNESLVKKEVSWYAGEDAYEAVAEIGAGIALGESFPQEVHDIYHDLDGPEEVYDFG